MIRSITAYLTEDHERIRALIARARAGDGEAYEELRGALLRHIGMEEKILLPALRAVGLDPPAMAQMRLDHSALVAMLVPPPSPELLDRLTHLLELHDPLEEGPEGLYALADESVPDVAEVLAALERAPVPPLAPHFDGPRAYAAVEQLEARAAEGRARG